MPTNTATNVTTSSKIKETKLKLYFLVLDLIF